MWLLKKLFKKRDEQLVGDGDIVKPFLDHLEDLRWTLMKMISVLAVTMVVAFFFRKTLAAWMLYPLRKAGIENILTTLGPIDAVTMSFTLSFYAGIVVSFPFLFYFLAEFLLPALTRKEKKYVLPAVGVGFGLFLLGVLLCFFFVLPPTLRWLYTDAAEFGVRPSWTMKEYYGFVTHMCIAVGLVFELPVVMVTLSAIGLISYAWLKGMRMYGYAIALVLAGIISPTPDLFMLFIFALPIMALFEVCIWIVWFLEKRRAKQEQAEEKQIEKHPEAQPYVPPPEDPNHAYHDEYHDEHGNYRGDHHSPGEYNGDHPEGGEHHTPDVQGSHEEKPAADKPPAEPEKPPTEPEKPKP